MAESIAQALSRLLGPRGVRESERPLALPGSAAEAAEVMKLAQARKWRVLPVGGQSFLGSPRGAELMLGTERLAELLAYEPSDPMASVGAGMTLAALAAETAKHGQWLPLDPPGGARATVGAALALGAAGPLRHGYGTAREHVLGLELVTGDGRVLQLGGKVLKNVAGYDLTRLAVGSRGALGLITAAHLKLRPRPEADETVAFRADALDDCLERARAATARPEAVALELLSPSLAERVAHQARWTVLARLHGEREAVAAARAALGFDAVDTECWARLEVKERAPVVARLAQRPTALAQTLALARTLGPAQLAAHAGDGIVRVLLEEVNEAALLHARTALAKSGGTLFVLPPSRLPAFGSPGAAGKPMRGLKQAFDPHDVLWDGGFDFLTG